MNSAKNIATDNDRVVILMGTFNGAKYLEAQLNSIAGQDYENWSLWISDDGSCDETLTILKRFQRVWGQSHEVRILTGPGRDACANYLHLLCHPDLPRAIVALSDQDDVWAPNKLSRAVNAIAAAGGGPVLYGAQYVITDAVLAPFATSRPPGIAPTFRNALLQNIVSGHTAVMNPAAVDLIRRVGPDPSIRFHDWWLYQLISGCGGHVIIDDASVLSYRQHETNVVGTNRGHRAMMTRLRQLFDGSYLGWLNAHSAVLSAHAEYLTYENREIVAALRHCRHKSGLGRVRQLLKYRLHRHRLLDTVLVCLALLWGRSSSRQRVSASSPPDGRLSHPQHPDKM